MSDPLILCYHALSPTFTATLSVTPERFERQVQSLLDAGWTPTTFTRAVLDPPSDRTLAITFDDAFLSVLELAQPILSALGAPATVFAPTASMAARQPLVWSGVEQWQVTEHAGEMTSMDWRDLGTLQQAGWEVGSHTRTHPHLTEIDTISLIEELERSREECRTGLGAAPSSIAYPYGDVDARVAGQAAAAGYTAGAALGGDLRPRGPLRAPRVGVYVNDDDRRFRLKTHPLGRAVRAGRPYVWGRRSLAAFHA